MWQWLGTTRFLEAERASGETVSRVEGEKGNRDWKSEKGNSCYVAAKVQKW